MAGLANIARQRSARAKGRFAVLLGVEGGHSIENSLDLLRHFHNLGVRYMTLTWANSNDWADSSGDIDDPTVPHHNGLTPFGRDVIREMNRLGMIVDVSHVSDKTFWDVLDTTAAPILATHSSARALTNTPRNLTDDQLRAVAKNNGAVMVNFYSTFIDEAFRQAIQAFKAERTEAHRALEKEFAARSQPVPFSASSAIDRAYAARDVHLMFLTVDSKWDPYRTDPRFAALLARCDFMGSPRQDAPAGV